jgi:hypothetical protein
MEAGIKLKEWQWDRTLGKISCSRADERGKSRCISRVFRWEQKDWILLHQIYIVECLLHLIGSNMPTQSKFSYGESHISMLTWDREACIGYVVIIN